MSDEQYAVNKALNEAKHVARLLEEETAVCLSKSGVSDAQQVALVRARVCLEEAVSALHDLEDATP